MKKVLELPQPIYCILRICDADVYNTIGAVYDYFLKILGHTEAWERKKFNRVSGVEAFSARECTLLGNQSTEDSGKKAPVGFTATQMVNFRWTKLASAGKTNMAHVLARWLNPACIDEDFDCDGQVELARKGLEHYFAHDKAKVSRIWTQHKLYMALDTEGPLFYNPDGKKKRTCDLEGPDHGCSGADWWFELEYPYDTQLKDLRAFAIKMLSQKAQESAAERHYSFTANIQSKNRARMNPESLEKRCLFRSEILQDIASFAGAANNYGLQTVDEAADGAADGRLTE